MMEEFKKMLHIGFCKQGTLQVVREKTVFFTILNTELPEVKGGDCPTLLCARVNAVLDHSVY